MEERFEKSIVDGYLVLEKRSDSKDMDDSDSDRRRGKRKSKPDKRKGKGNGKGARRYIPKFAYKKTPLTAEILTGAVSEASAMR